MMDISISEEITNLILICKFDQANLLIKSYNKKELESFLLKLSNNDPSIAVYGFIVHNLIIEENSFWHELAAVIFLTTLCHIQGAYSLGTYHVRKAIKLEPNSISATQLLLSFYNSPETNISNDEARITAKEILDLDSENKYALRILESLK